MEAARVARLDEAGLNTRLAAVVVAAASAGACWRARVPAAGDAIPGTRWEIADKPWRLPVAIQGIVPDGRTAVVVGGLGTILRVDLTTGRVVAMRWLPRTSLSGAARVSDTRWVVGATDEQSRFHAYSIDAATLDPTEIALPAPVPHAARLAVALGRTAEGGVVIAGPDQPAAIYDPISWQRRGELPATARWSGDVLSIVGVPLASGDELTTAQITKPEAGARMQLDLATRHGTTVARVRSANDLVGEVELGSTMFRIETALDQIAVSPDGARVATLAGGVLAIVDAASQKELARYDLGASARTTPAHLVLEDHRAIVTAGTTIRVVDLATGAVTPDGGPPYAYTSASAVADDGRVLAIGGSAWSFSATGALASDRPIGDRTVLHLPMGGVDRYADGLGNERPELEIRDAASGRVSREITIDPQATEGWLGTRDELVALTAPGSLWRRAGDEMTLAVQLSHDAYLAEVDPDTGTALVEVGGAVHAISLRDAKVGPALRAPACGELDVTAIEHGGSRAVVADGSTAYVWERARATLAGSLRLGDEEILSATFVPRHDEVLLELRDALVIWSIADRTTRRLALGSSYTLAIAPGGKRLLLSLATGRTAVVDLDALRDALPEQAAMAGAPPVACPGGDVLAATAPDDEEGGAP